MAQELASLQIPKELVEQIINTHVQAAVVQALQGRDAILQEAVTRVMNQKVNADGNISQYSSDNKFNLIDALLSKALRESIKEALKEEIANHQALIRSALAAEFKKSKSKLVSNLLEAMTTGIAKSVADYSFKLEVHTG